MSIRLGVLRLDWRGLFAHASAPRSERPWQARIAQALWEIAPRSKASASEDKALPHPGDLKGDLFSQNDADVAPQIETVMLERFSCVTMKKAP